MATIAEVRNRAARMLGILGDGQTLSSSDASEIRDAYDNVYAELEALGLNQWGSTDDIPTKYVESVAALVAMARSIDYTIPLEKYQQLQIAAQTGMATIRAIQMKEKMGQTEVEYF